MDGFERKRFYAILPGARLEFGIIRVNGEVGNLHARRPICVGAENQAVTSVHGKTQRISLFGIGQVGAEFYDGFLAARTVDLPSFAYGKTGSVGMRNTYNVVVIAQG